VVQQIMSRQEEVVSHFEDKLRRTDKENKSLQKKII